MQLLTIGLIVLNLFLAMALKYLWNAMNILQFLIFMREWQIYLPPKAASFIKELRNLALLEFIPLKWFQNSVKTLFGMPIEDEEAESCAAQSNPCGKSLVDNLGAMPLIALIILLCIGLMLLTRCLARKSARIGKLCAYLKRKLFYNTLLRYVLQSTLKMQFAALAVITCAKAAEGQSEAETSTTGSMVVSWTILAIFNICPLVFFRIMHKYKGRLGEPEVRQKFGTLYLGLNPKKPNVGTYPLTFLIRRSVFVAITFALATEPGIQIQLTTYLTLWYIIYVGYAEFFETPGGKRLEIVNESLFVIIQYHFVLLQNLVWEFEAREQIGNSIIGVTSLLIAINVIAILVVSFRALCRKIYLNNLKKKAIKNHKEMVERKKQ